MSGRIIQPRSGQLFNNVTSGSFITPNISQRIKKMGTPFLEKELRIHKGASYSVIDIKETREGVFEFLVRVRFEEENLNEFCWVNEATLREVDKHMVTLLKEFKDNIAKIMELKKELKAFFNCKLETLHRYEISGIENRKEKPSTSKTETSLLPTTPNKTSCANNQKLDSSQKANSKKPSKKKEKRRGSMDRLKRRGKHSNAKSEIFFTESKTKETTNMDYNQFFERFAIGELKRIREEIAHSKSEYIEVDELFRVLEEYRVDLETELFNLERDCGVEI